MEKIIEINQSQTVDGITITLERIELSTTEMKVYVTKTPGYNPPQSDVPGITSITGTADIRGTYRIDDGPTLTTGFWRERPLENGAEYIWEGLYPVPSDARVLSFTVTRLSIAYLGVFGPWEFTIQLK